ncbi:MAG TPA: cysteine desulfurase NifS, partial [Chloroflexota bacterium]|nr:cysteine desulfurase NifS [Chloroflexota bacterium]
TEDSRLARQRDELWHGLLARIPGLERNGDRESCLPNTLNVSFPKTSGAAVLAHTPGVAASTGAACHSAIPEPSAVLMAMGLPRERALGAARLSLGRWTTDQEVARAAELLAAGWQAAVAAGATPGFVLDIAAQR